MAELTVPARFNGPRESGQGGYSAALLAAQLEGPAAVSLRSPVPLDRPLRIVRADGAARAFDGETLVAEAAPAPPLALAPPRPVTLAEARAAERLHVAHHDTEFSRCFVCGADRPDRLGVWAGPVTGTELVASAWTPPAWTAGADGLVRPEVVWAALDCPTYFAVYGEALALAFLVRQQVEIHGPIRPGTEYAVIAWPLAAERRKRSAGAALLDADGRTLAIGEALMVEVPSSE